jgi:hypothetical protein
MAVSYRRFLYQNIRRGLNSMDDSKSFMVFDQINMAVTNAALDKLKQECDPDLDSATVRFIHDFAEDVSNSKLVADLISNDQQPGLTDMPTYRRKVTSPTAMDSFNTYITQLGSPRHLLESLAVAAANWEMLEQQKAKEKKNTNSSMDKLGDAGSVPADKAPFGDAWENEVAAVLKDGGELSIPVIFEKFPELFNEIREDRRKPSGKSAVDYDGPALLFDPADIPPDDEDEDEDTDFVFRILGAASPQDRKQLIASAAEELDDELGTFPRRALSDKFRQLVPPPPSKDRGGGATAVVQPDNVNVSSVLDRLLQFRELIASELAVAAEVRPPFLKTYEELIRTLQSSFDEYFQAIRPMVEEEMAKLSSLYGVRNSPPTLTFIGPTQLSSADQSALTPPLAAMQSQGEQQSLYRFIFDPRSNSTLKNREVR